MSLTVADYYAQRKYMPPFAASDPALLLDVDFRAGQAAVETLLATHNILPVGAGGLWDAQRGFNPNGTRAFVRQNWIPAGHASRAAAFASHEFTIAVEVERTAVASCWLDDSLNFIDSASGPSAPCWNGAAIVPANHLYGDYTAGTKIGCIFVAGPVAGSNHIKAQYQVSNNAGAPAGRLACTTYDTAVMGVTMRARPTVPRVSSADPDHMQIVWACKGRELDLYIDGKLEYHRTRTVDFWTEDLFYYLFIGCQYPAGQNALRGYIRRFQVANRAAYANRFAGPRVVFGPGDSFMRRGAGYSVGDAPTVADLNAAQNGLYVVSKDTNNNAGINPVIGGHWRPWIHELVRCAAQEGLPFRFYCAGDSGHCWSLTGSVSPLPEYRAAYIDSIVEYDGEIGVGLGSVNDVNGYNTATNYLDETRAKLTSIISRSYNMRRYLFVECFPGFKGWSVTADPLYIAEYHRQRALQAQLHGYTVTNAAGRDVSVEFIPVYDALGGDAHSGNYTEGGHELAPLWDAAFGTTKTMNDLHPGQEGMDMMVDILWPKLREAILELAIA